MVIRTCPRCDVRYALEENDLDFIHVCNSGEPALDQEDVLVIGKWEDFTGSDATVQPNASRYAGAENAFWGERADIEGEAGELNLSDRGLPKTRFRQRQHEEFIALKKRRK